MFTGPSVREIDATLESSCGRLVPFESGRGFIALMELMFVCGVGPATRYCTPRLSSQYVGDTTELLASATSRSLAMSRSVRPTSPAMRTEERRVGKGWRSRWSAYH